MRLKKIKKEKTNMGFTLIELLVALALFAIVIVIVIGAILSVVDANRKARSLMTVMNNLNFAVDSMVRSFNTGVLPSDSESNQCFSTEEVDYRELGPNPSASEVEDNQNRRTVRYCWAPAGYLTKTIDGQETTITSPDIDIDYAFFKVIENPQPRLLINISGTVQSSPTISSSFNIQTTAAQRKIVTE